MTGPSVRPEPAIERIDRSVRSTPRLRAVVMLLLLGLCLPGRGADPLALVMVHSGLLGEAARVQPRFVEHLVTLDVPDDHGRLTTAVRSMFPPSAVRGRWLDALAERITPGDLRAAADYWASVPGAEVGRALQRVRRDPAAAARRAAEERSPAGAARLDAAVTALGAAARERVVETRALAAARWTARSVDGGDLAALDAALATALEIARAEARPRPRDDVRTALAGVPALYVEGLIDWATSAPGRRFLDASAASLDAALDVTLRGHAGVMQAALRAREADRDGRALEAPISLEPDYSPAGPR